MEEWALERQCLIHLPMQETQEMQVQPLGREDPLKQDPSILAGFPGGSDGKKNNPPAMQETWVQSLGWEDALKNGMAIHSSILAWRIPWREYPGGL